MTTLKEAVLNYMDIETLKCILDDYELADQADKRSPSNMRRALDEYGDLAVQALFEYLYETDIKALCEQLDVNSKGRKNALIERLVDTYGIEQEASSEEDEEDDESIKPEDATGSSDLDVQEQDDGQDEVDVTENRTPAPRPGRRPEVPPTPTGDYEFEPIQGYPMLNWRGKRPFRSTQFYPAQLKEQHGPEVDGWRNRIYWGDNLQVMSHLLKEFRGEVDLVYIDPPFDSKADYKKEVKLAGDSAKNDLNSFEEKQYTDIWTNDEYIQFMYERIVLARELITERGSIYIHADHRKMHYLRLVLDEVFGLDNFRNEIVWHYFGFKRKTARKFPQKHDLIVSYTKSENYLWNVQFRPHSDEYIARFKTDEAGRKYRDDVNPTGGGSRIIYLDEVPGDIIDSAWSDIPPVNPVARERQNYPTQKPEALLERIICASSNPGDIVFDCFMGSGTTQAVAMKLGRRFIGADINLGAVQTTTKRLLKVAEELNEKQARLALEPIEPASTNDPDDDKSAEPTVFYTGFNVSNVNHYDVFRNPAQAKDLLIEALEIQPLGAGSLYDGEKDERMVKIMPVNRIATKADLNELTAGFDWKGFERKQRNQKPNQPVEKILLVCMGHEPDLAATLVKEAAPFKIDVEVVDILRDKSNLEFKRDAEADVTIEDGQLVIRAFYPMNLLQKLSLMKEQVDDWRELVESIMVDWNYDGAVLEPAVVDLPGKNEMVIGAYSLPFNAGTIRVKITDLLSESLEVEVAHG